MTVGKRVRRSSFWDGHGRPWKNRKVRERRGTGKRCREKDGKRKEGARKVISTHLALCSLLNVAGQGLLAAVC